MWQSISRYVIIVVGFFLAYNEFVDMGRPSTFDKIGKGDDKGAVTHALGNFGRGGQYDYTCGGGQPVALYPYIERLCVKDAQDVVAFPLCYISLRCPGWYYIAFDKNGKVLAKYYYGS